MKREISDVLRLYSASLLSGWFALLFFYIAELILIYWFSGKLRPARFLYYFGAYMVIGTVFGLGTGTAHALLTRLIKGRFTLKPEPLSLALNVSGLLCFLSFVVLNAHYMPLSPITSAKSLALNFAIAGSFVFLLPLFYVLAGRTTPFPAPYRTMSVCSSAAIAFVAFQALISKILGGGEYTTSISAGLTFLSLSAGSIAALADLSILNILAGTKRGGSRASLSKKVLLGKCVVAASAFAIIASGWFANDNERPVAESRGMSAATPGAESPNVIFIVLDTVRQDRLSVYGCERETSPNIARFAEKSWVFDAYSTATWTLPSHASIVTGLYPTENGTGLDSHNYIEQRNETIAEILTENGYSTAAVVANHLALGPSSGFSQGFGYYYAEPRETDPVFPLVAHSFLRKFLPRSSASRILPCQRAESINKEAIRWIEERSREPFFLFLNYMDAHTPYAAPLPFNRRWYHRPSALEVYALEHNYLPYENADEARRRMVETERAHRLGQYDGEIAYLDSQLGVLFEKLKEIGVFDDSLIVLTSDHGEFIFEHELLMHPPAVYEEAIRVPLIVKPPVGMSEKAGDRISYPVSLVDLTPSVLKYLGITRDTRPGGSYLFDGQSMPIFTEAHVLEGQEDSEFARRFGLHKYSVIYNNHKLIYSSNQTYEFYNLSADRSESTNLAGQSDSEEVETNLSRMKSDLDFRISRIKSNRLEAGELSAGERAEVQSRLKALGYIQ